MSEKKTKNKKVKNNKNQRDLKVPPIGIIDNIVMSKTEVWAYYILSEKPYDFLSNDARVTLANSTMTSLAGLCQSADKKVDCHLLISNQAFDPSDWYNQMYQIHHDLIGSETKPFNDFVLEQAMDLYEKDYRKRVTYLGVKLFNRGSFDVNSINPLEFGFKEAVAAFKKSVSGLFQFSSTEISYMEEKRAREAEAEIYRILSNSSLRAKKPTSEELLLTIKRRFYPAMPTPYLDTDHEHRIGLSDIVIETGGIVEVKSRWLKISQFMEGQELDGYRATLSFSKLPNEMYFPSPLPPFLYRASMLPFTVNCRFTLVPTEDMKKQLDKKKLEAEDEIKNLAESGQRVNANIKDTMSNINLLEEDLHDVKQPWISGSYRLTIEATTEEALKDIITALKQEYAESSYVLTWTTGDQLELFREEFLGGKTEKSDFIQTTNLALIGIAGINFGGSAGDPVRQSNKYSRKDIR